MTRRCPSARALERAYWSGDEQVGAHARDCARGCAETWAEIDGLAALARADRQPAPSADAREELRTAIVAGAGRPPVVRSRRWTGYAAAGAVAAAAIALVWMTRADDSAGGEIRRATVRAHGVASIAHHSPGPDEVVRLTDGAITVDVAPLVAGERFRVITGDAEVEVIGTSFEVAAERDRLIEVRVARGVVVVRSDHAGERTLRAGDRWRVVDEMAEQTPVDLPVPPVPGPVVADDEPGIAAPSPAPRRIRQPAPRPPAPAADPGDAAYEVGWDRLRAGRFADAATELGRAAGLAVDPALAADARYWQGVALARAGKAAAARATLEQFLRDHARSERAGEAHVIIGWMAFEARDYGVAERHFRAAASDPAARVRQRAADGLERIEQLTH